MDFNSMIANVRRAMSLDRSFYQEVAYNERYSQEALMVVIVAAVLTGVGSFLSALFGGNFLGALIGLVISVILAVAGYYIWAYIVQFVGKALFGGQATAPELLVQMCAQCHNNSTDTDLSRSRFNAFALDDLDAAARETIIERLRLPDEDRYKMPPAFMRSLSADEIDRIEAFLRR